MRRLPAMCLALAALARCGFAAELCEGERLGTEWLAKSGVDVAFDRGETIYSGDEAAGGRVSLVEFPDGSGNRALRVDETSEGEQGNRASCYRFRVGRDAAAIARINEVLARPTGEAAVPFVFSFRVARLARASRFIYGSVNVEFLGGRRPARFVLTGSRELARHPAYREGKGFAVFDNAVAPAMRFLVTPCGGTHAIDGLEFRMDVRVDWGSTPESFVMDDLALHEIEPPRQAGESAGTVLFVGSAPSTAFIEAARALKLRVGGVVERFDGEADVYVVSAGLHEKWLVEPLAKALARGASVIFSVPSAREAASEELQALLPVNTWSMLDRLRRYDAGLAVREGSDLAKALGAAGTDLAVSWRYDMHLPFAPIESAEHRYHWDVRAKPMLNTDWRVQLTTDLDGHLPVLATGRTGPGRIAVFASDIYDATLSASPGCKRFARALLEIASPAPTPEAQTAPEVALAIDRHQPGGLAARVTNKGRRTSEVVVSYKVSNWARELMNVATVTVRVPAGRTVAVPLEERHPDRCEDEIATSADAALPLRRVHVAAATPDRRSVIAEATRDVLTAPQASLEVFEDPATYGDMKDWPGQARPDGYHACRYVYRPGTRPKIELHLRNALVNVAPLARARDVSWPENPSAQGLNDLSYTHSCVRGKVPLEGAWSGKSAAEQRLELAWDAPVTLARHRIVGMGKYRNWYRANPTKHAVVARGPAGERELVRQDDARFEPRHGDVDAYHSATFEPFAAKSVELRVSGLDPKQNLEPRHAIVGDRTEPSNCTVLEWEIYGWPEAKLPKRIEGRLTVVAHDPFGGRETEVLNERVSVDALDELVRAVELPTRDAFGPMRADVKFVAGRTRVERSFDVLFVPEEGRKLLNKELQRDWEKGQLCTPGWVQVNDFGKGMRRHTQGWGGPHDQVWALVHNLMETGTRSRDNPARMFTTANRVCHYTNPWRTTPDGVYSWKTVTDEIVERTLHGDWQRRGKRLHIVGSDRWNGLNTGTAFGWSEFALFDEYLRRETGAGLEGRSRDRIVAEITSKYADRWQAWQMDRYADELAASQEKFAANGLTMTFESHGSFPFAGGELGAKLARTHIAVGTDLFWELRNQDVYWSIGTRFGVVAANPDLRSGAYCQWGWDNSDLNRYWFSNNGSVEPARRQWYATYFAGRVTLGGEFEPYHIYGFSSQGGHSTKFYPDDLRWWTRTQNFMAQVRPERPAGFGIVVSWPAHERRMSPKAGGMGFGLYAGAGHEQLDIRMGRVYHKLVKNGLPVSFVSSTHAMKAWRGREPLVVVDGYDLEEWELADLERLNAAGAAVIAIGDVETSPARERADAFYGVRVEGRSVEARAGTREVKLAGDQRAFVRRGDGGAPVVLVPHGGRDLSGRSAALLVKAVLSELGDPISTSPGLAVTPMVSNDSLFLLFGDQADVGRTERIEVKPAFFLPKLAGAVRVIDLDRGAPLDARRGTGGAVSFELDVPPTAGRAVLVTGGGR